MKPHIRVGTRVQRSFADSEGVLQTECGVVVHLWSDPETGDEDAYIAFFGDHFPNGKPASKPYILRYFVTGLEVVE
ncbi:MAG: hypothetical protein R3B90_00635 [Planctomycetaceae bacterium]